MTTKAWPWLTTAAALTAALTATGGAAHISAARAVAATVAPGSTVTIADESCEAGAALHQGSTVYLAIPASCLGSEPGKPQDGCAQAEAPLGSTAQIEGARHRGVLVYSSFTRMQANGTAAAHRCAFNDLALIRVNKADRSRVIGTVPGTAAPKAVSGRGPSSGSAVTLGGSSATSEGSTDTGWAYQVRTSASPSAGDVGEPLVQGGKLMGMLTVVPTTLPYQPYALVADFHRAMVLLRRAPGFHHVTVLPAAKRG